jgi:spermidine synthase
MIPWVLLDTAPTPEGRELRLMRRGTEFSIMVGGNELMNSRLSGSERALASLAAERLRGRPAPTVLIGGLGMGFTLRTALAELPPDARLVVAEIVPAVVAWAKGPLAGIFEGCLADPRVSVRETDVGELIAAGRATYDAILLDVDNGPGGISRDANDGLYSAGGLAAARRALRPGGLLAVWSASQDRSFTARLQRAGFKVEEAPVRASGTGRGARHLIWLATAP